MIVHENGLSEEDMLKSQFKIVELRLDKIKDKIKLKEYLNQIEEADNWIRYWNEERNKAIDAGAAIINRME